MTEHEYLERIKARLLSEPLIERFQIIRARETAQDGYIRAKLALPNDHFLEFSEYFTQTPEGEIWVVTYSYHWADAEGKLIRRWDNTPHFPNLPNFPHHVHMGEEQVTEGQGMDIFKVLDEIGEMLSQ